MEMQKLLLMKRELFIPEDVVSRRISNIVEGIDTSQGVSGDSPVGRTLKNYAGFLALRNVQMGYILFDPELPNDLFGKGRGIMGDNIEGLVGKAVERKFVNEPYEITTLTTPSYNSVGYCERPVSEEEIVEFIKQFSFKSA